MPQRHPVESRANFNISSVQGLLQKNTELSPTMEISGLQHIHSKQCMGHGSISYVPGLQSSHPGAKRELLSFHLSSYDKSNLIWPLHLKPVIHGCSTPLQGRYKALISTGTMLQKQPSLPDVQSNLTVTTTRAEGKAGGALIQTMESTEILMENKTVSLEEDLCQQGTS